MNQWTTRNEYWKLHQWQGSNEASPLFSPSSRNKRFPWGTSRDCCWNRCRSWRGRCESPVPPVHQNNNWIHETRDDGFIVHGKNLTKRFLQRLKTFGTIAHLQVILHHYSEKRIDRQSSIRHTLVPILRERASRAKGGEVWVCCASPLRPPTHPCRNCRELSTWELQIRAHLDQLLLLIVVVFCCCGLQVSGWCRGECCWYGYLCTAGRVFF